MLITFELNLRHETSCHHNPNWLQFACGMRFEKSGQSKAFNLDAAEDPLGVGAAGGSAVYRPERIWGRLPGSDDLFGKGQRDAKTSPPAA